MLGGEDGVAWKPGGLVKIEEMLIGSVHRYLRLGGRIAVVMKVDN